MAQQNNGNGAGHGLLLGGAIAVGLVVAALLLGRALTAFKAYDRAVTVKGLAERVVPSNLAFWPVSYAVAADDLVALQQAVDSNAAVVVRFLREQGFGEEEIRTEPPVITDQYAMNYGGNTRPEHRYTAQAVVIVRSAHADRVKAAMGRSGDLVARGVALARDYEHMPSFLFTGLNAIKPEMIAEATKNARAAAMQFAQDSGSRVGGIRRATQGLFTIRDRDAFTPEQKVVRVVTTVQYFLED